MDELATSARKLSSRTKGERTRENILQAAENAFAEQGYERATLRDVAKAARIQQPGIYNYFKTKRDLYEAVLERMLHPLIDAFDEIAALPTADESHSETRLVDLLVANPNIPNLLVRAFLSTNQTEKEIAVRLTNQVLEHVPKRSLRRNSGSQDTASVLKDMATFNVWFGYFWAAPIIEMISGRRITDTDMLESQKDLLVTLADIL
jgi:AcrR family transcriptional regulator